MSNFAVSLRRGRVDLVIMVTVLVALLGILVLQYVSSRRLAQVEVIAQQTGLARYLRAVDANVREVYETAADRMLDVPPHLLEEHRFDDVKRIFDGLDTAPARLLFAGALDECACRARFYDPETETMRVGPEPGGRTARLIAHVSAQLFAHTVHTQPPQGKRPPLAYPNVLYVNEADADNRAVYRFVTSDEGDAIGFVGFVIDVSRFEREYLPEAMAGAMDRLSGIVQDNLVVRATDETGRVVTASHDEAGQADALDRRFGFVFRDWAVSASSRHTAAAQLLQANALVGWMLTLLMSASVLAGVLLTGYASRRDYRLWQMRSAFVANVSHELRTPLASISVFGELMRSGRVSTPQKVAEYGGHIEHESIRLRHLIDNVLNFARMESDRGGYSPQSAAMEDIVDDAVRAVDVQRARSGFGIEVNRPAAALPAVDVDASALTLVFVNLLDNAMKYSGASRRLCVDLGLQGGDVAVAVTDFGIGIDAGDRERLFDRFFRGTRALDRGVTGTGLGLAIVAHVVEAHGGSVHVQSDGESGATFTVLIPVLKHVQPAAVFGPFRPAGVPAPASWSDHRDRGGLEQHPDRGGRPVPGHGVVGGAAV